MYSRHHIGEFSELQEVKGILNKLFSEPDYKRACSRDRRGAIASNTNSQKFGNSFRRGGFTQIPAIRQNIK
ncbi:hypothetical protein BCD67_04680 [Oscillatoriales cyanobacterium USR001]|nr:hypothetical protein BCD67_04680 [Oscillatoriales cyanobacterium USR001]